MLSEPKHILIFEQASLEIVPKRLRLHEDCTRVEKRFGVKPEMQILDANFHSHAMVNLTDREKRGRPDVVHFALLDATSTPLFMQGKLEIVIHTIDGTVIVLKEGTRPPRTLQRFCGVMAKLISSRLTAEERRLFDVLGTKRFEELVSFLGAQRVISFSRQGRLETLSETIANVVGFPKRTALVVGGFAHGQFAPDVVENSDDLVAISDHSLPAHVATARICYELERNLLPTLPRWSSSA